MGVGAKEPEDELPSGDRHGPMDWTLPPVRAAREPPRLVEELPHCRSLSGSQ
jgi:hypothetical protein